MDEILQEQIENYNSYTYKEIIHSEIKDCLKNSEMYDYLRDQLRAQLEYSLDELEPFFENASERYYNLDFPDQIKDSPQHQKFRQYLNDNLY
jgi:hypothetical protein